MKVSARIQAILNKSLEGSDITKQEALDLLRIDETGEEMYALISTANAMTRRDFGNKGFVFGQVGIDVSPCSRNCAFCSLAEKWELMKSHAEFSLEEVVEKAKAFERDGVNAIFLMTTADYPFEKYLEIGKAVRKAISPEMPLCANIGDFGEEEAEKLVDAGFQWVYHVFRLREGKDTEIDPKIRKQTFTSIKNSDLDLFTCLEPIGPEHSLEELIDEIYRAKEFGPSIMAAMSRVPVSGLPLAEHGKVPELFFAKVTAVVRIVMNVSITAMGIHEPAMLPLIAGGNQIFAEAGPNPRDTVDDTSKGRGRSVEDCQKMLWEAGYTPMKGPFK